VSLLVWSDSSGTSVHWQLLELENCSRTTVTAKPQTLVDQDVVPERSVRLKDLIDYDYRLIL
jgi:hypothetical protein